MLPPLAGRFGLESIVAVAAVALVAGTSTGEPPPGFALTTIATGFEQPPAFAFGPDGQVFVAEKAGRVKVVDGGATRLLLDLTAEVNDSHDRGLLGIALDPAFATTGRVFLSFIAETGAGTPGSTSPAEGKVIRIAQAAGDRNAADPATRVDLITGFDAHDLSHDGGGLRFDPAGRLLASFGDGSSFDYVDPRALSSGDLDSPSGKILRIDPETGAGVAGNPYFDP